jgi:hypothetical protein
VRGERVAESVGRYPLLDIHTPGRGGNCLGNRGLMQVMTPPNAATGVDAQSAGREYVFPPEIASGAGRLSLKRTRQFHAAEPAGQILLVKSPRYFYLAMQSGLGGGAEAWCVDPYLPSLRES